MWWCGGVPLPKGFYIIRLRGREVDKFPLIFSATLNLLPRHISAVGRSLLFLKRMLDLVLNDGLRWLQDNIMEERLVHFGGGGVVLEGLRFLGDEQEDEAAGVDMGVEDMEEEDNRLCAPECQKK
ncbi:hypothetical protein SUGI_0649250 [Cryptomeria japonica]|nr:hypothetical protein SUGI_0649250 [Cryptomeria japonica]